MIKHILIIALILFCLKLQAQDYVDIVKATAHLTQMGNDVNDLKTNIYNQNLQVYYPKRFSEKFVLLTGFTFENTSLVPTNGANSQNLLMGRLNLGVKLKYNERWGATYLVLPKIASNFQSVSLKDFQIGGLGLFDYTINEQWKFKFGVYVSTENHGSTVTPLLGLWHRSKNGKFYINATLPIRADINYNFVKGFSMGLDLLTSVKSYDLSQNIGEFYVQEESIRTAMYLSYAFLDKALILRAKAGLDLTDYGQFNTGDKIGAQLLTTPLSGDNRNRLNPEYQTSFYVGIDLIYRFDLTKE